MKSLIRGGEALAAFLGLDQAALAEAILYEALPVFECGGELFACPRPACSLAICRSCRLAP